MTPNSHPLPSVFQAQQRIDEGWPEEKLRWLAKEISECYHYNLAFRNSRIYADWSDDYKSRLDQMDITLKADYMLLRDYIQSLPKEKP